MFGPYDVVRVVHNSVGEFSEMIGLTGYVVKVNPPEDAPFEFDVTVMDKESKYYGETFAFAADELELVKENHAL